MIICARLKDVILNLAERDCIVARCQIGKNVPVSLRDVRIVCDIFLPIWFTPFSLLGALVLERTLPRVLSQG